ncbi:CRISPR-associated protein Cas5 [Nitratifractor salsuginis]|uniref:CRISPR-associated protein, Cas5h family n=1 Tax=Nitratifractor salsuginis (strain DSM 16511 / JCM 12458 / E9I37-1) TaxID=749222 RepID=E6WXQ1_NITSE|nr:CRISPR-associated protein Cas5 [Nitratifractor salsuginis]ADV46308.1 CRISPR-associated protein, Cas5h family [Nitratifractor salsuginis DSM 16511]
MSEKHFVAFKVWGDYAHFSHPATIYSSLTYPLPPKTAIMGFLGALIGEDAHHKLSSIRYSVKIDRPLVKKRFVFNGIKFALSSNMHIDKGYQDAGEKKQFYRELICNPAYTIFLEISGLEKAYRERIVEHLREHKTCYTPYLGINFCIADFLWIPVESFEKVTDAECKIDTFVPKEDFMFDAENYGVRLTTTRMACGVEEGRVFKDFQEFVVEISAGQKIDAKNRGDIYRLNDYYVYFV